MAPNNTLPVHGNEKTMNLNHMILTNIQASPYFKVNLFDLKTYHEVVDEIYYKVAHLEPWEKGSRKTAGQTGMCGGVRGVGAGGIVSSCYCLLYKLYTLKLTRKQLNGLLTHQDSPFIRALGFMYIRYTQPPQDLWDWYEEYLEDEEEIDVKAGGGHSITIGEMVYQFMTKLEWYSTLFPRIPVPVQKMMESKMSEYENSKRQARVDNSGGGGEGGDGGVGGSGGSGGGGGEDYGFGEAERLTKLRGDSPPRQGSVGGSRRPTPPFDIAREFDKDSKNRRRSRSHERDRKKRSRSRDRKRSRSHERRKHRSRSRERRHRSRSRSPKRSKHSRRSRSKDRGSKRRSRDRDIKHVRESSFERDLRRERDRVEKQRRDRHDYK